MFDRDFIRNNVKCLEVAFHIEDLYCTDELLFRNTSEKFIRILEKEYLIKKKNSQKILILVELTFGLWNMMIWEGKRH